MQISLIWSEIPRGELDSEMQQDIFGSFKPGEGAATNSEIPSSSHDDRQSKSACRQSK